MNPSIPSRPMNRRGFLGLLGAGTAAVTAAPLLSACGAQTGSTGSKSLVVATWKGYGADLDWALADFKKKTGASVTFQYMESEQNLIDMLKNGGTGTIDVALPNLQYTPPAIKADLLEPVDLSKISNYEQLFPELRSQKDNTADGKTYGVPWVWGMDGMLYSNKITPKAPDSWAALWEPEFKGKLGLLDDASAAILIASLYLGENPDDPDLTKVEKALKELKANAKMLWTAKDDFSRAFDNGSVIGGTVYGSLGGQMVSEGKAVTYKIPKEGGVGFIDNWTVVKGTTKADLAHQWIDYMISKQFQGKWASKAEWSSPVPGNKSAVTSLDAAATQRLQIEDIGIMSKLTMEKYLPPKQLQAWTDLWNRVKAS